MIQDIFVNICSWLLRFAASGISVLMLTASSMVKFLPLPCLVAGVGFERARGGVVDNSTAGG